MKKQCAMCLEVKNIENFRKNKHIVHGKMYNHYDSYCKDCRRLYDKEWKRIKRAKIKEEYL